VKYGEIREKKRRADMGQIVVVWICSMGEEEGWKEWDPNRLKRVSDAAWPAAWARKGSAVQPQRLQWLGPDR
jgi:hypothetical protein